MRQEGPGNGTGDGKPGKLAWEWDRKGQARKTSLGMGQERASQENKPGNEC